MNKFRNCFSPVLCLVLCMILCGSVSAFAKDNSYAQNPSVQTSISETGIDSLIKDIIKWNVSATGSSDINEWINDHLSANIGGSADWYVLGLSQYSGYDLSRYGAALVDHLNENDVKNASSRLKFALVLTAIGIENEYTEKCLNDGTIGEQGIMSYIFGLHLLNNGYESDVISQEEIVSALEGLRHEDGGWSISGSYGDIDVTSMVLQALAPMYTAGMNREGTDNTGLYEPVIEMVDCAVDFLSSKQLEEGDFSSYGSRNAESTAQVIVCLSALGIDCASDSCFIKNGNSVIDGLLRYRLEDGSFSHTEGTESNGTATVQAFYSLVAYRKMLEGRGPLYVFSQNSESGEKQEDDLGDDTDLVGQKEDGSRDDTDLVGQKEDGFRNDAESVGKRENEFQTDISSAKSSRNGTGTYKIYAVAILLGICAVICIILMILRKNKKNLLFVAIAAAAGILFIIFTDFSSAESYYSGNKLTKENRTGTVTMSISCGIVADKTDPEYIPQDGVILAPTVFELAEGETAYDILTDAAKQYNISIDHKGTAGMIYISGINYLYELEFGDLSGWVYKVNNELPSVGCAAYTLKDGDVIEWCYTLDLGNDTFD